MRRFLFPFLLLTTPAFADPRTDCPPPSPCVIIQLNAEETKIMLDKGGILDTAASARSLDLGALTQYFRQKITTAPAGDVKLPEAPKPPAAPMEPSK